MMPRGGRCPHSDLSATLPALPVLMQHLQQDVQRHLSQGPGAENRCEELAQPWLNPKTFWGDRSLTSFFRKPL